MYQRENASLPSAPLIAIASRAGPGALVRLYRAVGTAADPVAEVDAQLRARLGLSYPQFVAEWRRAVRAEFG